MLLLVVGGGSGLRVLARSGSKIARSTNSSAVPISSKDGQIIRGACLSRSLPARPGQHRRAGAVCRTADRVVSSPLHRLHVMEIYRDTWTRAPEKIDLGIRAGEIAVELGRFDDAVTIADQLAKSTGSNADDAIKAQAARPHQGTRPVGTRERPGHVGSESNGRRSSPHSRRRSSNPRDIDLAVRLADIDRHRLRDPAAPKRQKLADDMIDAMVVRNSDRPEAWLARYVYRRSLKRPANRFRPTPMPISTRRSKSAGPPDQATGRRAALRGPAPPTRTTAPRPCSSSSGRRGAADGSSRLAPLGRTRAADGTDAGRTRAVDIWAKGLEMWDTAKSSSCCRSRPRSFN